MGSGSANSAFSKIRYREADRKEEGKQSELVGGASEIRDNRDQIAIKSHGWPRSLLFCKNRFPSFLPS